MADPTGNPSAEVAAAAPFDQLQLWLQDGGPVLYLLLAISIVALTIILAKLLQFTRLGLAGRGFVEQVLKDALAAGPERALAAGPERALDGLSERRDPVARVMAAALHGRSDPRLSEESVKEEVVRIASLQLDYLRSGLRALSLIATLSPLIGLLGTVLGMIEAFQALEAAGSRVDPAILSGGIWVALLTTAAGLIVAIPAAAAHNWCEGQVNRSRRAMEDAATQVFTLPLSAGGHRAPAQPAE